MTGLAVLGPILPWQRHGGRLTMVAGNGDRFPALIDECLSLKPEVIAVTTTPAAHLLKRQPAISPLLWLLLAILSGPGSSIAFQDLRKTSSEKPLLVRVVRPRWKRWSGLPLPKTSLGLLDMNVRPAVTSLVY
jgi:hypothetical protein